MCVLGFNHTSALSVGHFVLSPREREKRDRRNEREEQGRKRNRNESEEKEEIKTFPLYKECSPCPTVSDRSVFSFPDFSNFSKYGFSPNLVCALILWRFALGLLMGKFHQFLTELSGWDTSIFSFFGR